MVVLVLWVGSKLFDLDRLEGGRPLSSDRRWLWFGSMGTAQITFSRRYVRRDDVSMENSLEEGLIIVYVIAKEVERRRRVMIPIWIFSTC